MTHHTKTEAREMMNRLGEAREPFLFVINYEMDDCRIVRLADVDPEAVLFDFNGVGNMAEAALPDAPSEIVWQKHPVSFEAYARGFDVVYRGLHRGDSFLTNLTGSTPVTTNLTLRDIALLGRAKYRLWLRDVFCALSPEIFVTIRDGRIASYPMKGTIDASLPDAEARILGDVKEAAEHATIVDLIRNDLSIYARDVRVERYRYIDRLITNAGALLQVSSEIAGRLPDDYRSHLGDILFDMLPAGSICGAPKKRTLEIIAEAEGERRGFYTGVAGIFDGRDLDSGVLIRFIEQTPSGELRFRSGGGITAKSDARSEYDELIQKVYVPIYRNHSR
jgi:para-aminobenzoate synthetase component 1